MTSETSKGLVNRMCVCGHYEGMHGPARDCWENFGFDDDGEQVFCKCRKFTPRKEIDKSSRAKEVL